MKISICLGHFDRGVKTGVGELTYANGNSYSGHIDQGRRHGFGRYESVTENYVYEGINLNIAVYFIEAVTDMCFPSGHWENDKKSGNGEIIQRTANAASYRGEFKEGKKHGRGILRCVFGKLFSRHTFSEYLESLG